MVADLSSPLHMQYVLETRGVILSEGYGKHEEALWNFITRLLRL